MAIPKTPTPHTQGVILFAHGARAASWAEPFERLCGLVQHAMPHAVVGLAYLEMMTPSLPVQVEALVANGVNHITVIPVFLGQGGHVRRDLPLLVEGVKQVYPEVHFEVATAVGEDDAVLQAMAHYCVCVAHPEPLIPTLDQ